MEYQLGCISSTIPVLTSLTFHKYSVKFPKDLKYDTIVRRLFWYCYKLLNKSILSTYRITEEENGLNSWIFTLSEVKENVFNEIVGKEITPEISHIGTEELNPKKHFKEFKNMLDVWIRFKLAKIFKHDPEYNAWFFQLYSLEKKEGALCFNVQVEYTPEGYIVLWIDPSIRVRYSLADYINDKLNEELKMPYTIQNIGTNNKLRDESAIRKALQIILEDITGEFAYGEGKTCNVVMFNKSGEKFVKKAKIISIIPEWTDKYLLEPSRQQVLVKQQATLLDYMQQEKSKTIHQYLLNRKTKENREYFPEYPVINVKTNRGLVTCTPSDVLISYRDEKLTLPPDRRYAFFDKIAKKIIEHVEIDFPFLKEYAKFSYIIPREIVFKRIPSYWEKWKLEVIDNTGIVPIKMLNEGGKPLGGPLKLFLLYIVPLLDNKKEEIEALVEKTNSLLSKKFKEHNLGAIETYSIFFYEWTEHNIEKTRENIRKALMDALKKSKEQYQGMTIFPIVVGPTYRGKYFEDVKRIASSQGKHSQVILWHHFKEMDEYTAATLACDIYIEALVQENIQRLNELDGLVWRLKNPADEKGKTIYIGFDYSYDDSGRVSGAFALLCDSYGRLISVKSFQLSSDTITEDAARDIFVYALETAKKYAIMKSLETPQRIVLYRDGECNLKEQINIINGLKRAKEALDNKERIHLDIVEVIKNHRKRIYRKTENNTENPKIGTYVVLPSLLGYQAGKMLAASTKLPKKKNEKVDFTIKPVELRYSSYGLEISNEETIVNEYLALTTLNFWNPFGKTKLCLPLLLAHKIANLTRIGVTPKIAS